MKTSVMSMFTKKSLIHNSVNGNISSAIQGIVCAKERWDPSVTGLWSSCSWDCWILRAEKSLEQTRYVFAV